MKHLWAIAAILALAGCSSQEGGAGAGARLGALWGVAMKSFADAPPAEDYGVTAEEMRAAPALWIGVDYLDAKLAMPRTHVSGGADVFLSADGVELVRRGPVLTRFVGVGVDLDGVFVGEADPAFTGYGPAAASGETYTRRYHYRDAQKRIVAQVLCSAAGADPVIETCQTLNAELRIENRYWLDAGGAVARAEHWTGPGAPVLGVRVLQSAA